MAYGEESNKRPRVSAYLGPSQFPLVSWRALFAGFFVTLLSFALLISLGLGIGGLTINELADFGAGMSWGAGIWLVASAILAIFGGSYFAARVSNYITTRIGAAQGLVIASLFFALFVYQLGSTVGWAGSQLQGAIGQVSSAVTNVASNPQVQQIAEDTLQDLDLETDPATVIQGVATRLLQGNFEGAKNYLARQANISPQEADQMLQNLNAQIQQQAQVIAQQSGDVISAIGWTLFLMIGLGSLAGILGGGLGSHENEKHPLSDKELQKMKRERVASL